MYGLGYTITDTQGFPGFTDASGAKHPSYVSLGFTDAALPVADSGSAQPFSVRVGLCYKTSTAAPASASAFEILQGRKSYGSPQGNQQTLKPDWFDLTGANSSGISPALKRTCGQLDNTNTVGTVPGRYPNTDPNVGCPAPNPDSQKNPGQGGVVVLRGVDVTPATMPKQLDPSRFYYDAQNGLLYLNLLQKERDAPAITPVGSCGAATSTDISCPEKSFYSCPAGGCVLYTVRVKDPAYNPSGPSSCAPYKPDGSSIYDPGVWDEYPPNMDQLAYVVPPGATNNPNAKNFLDPLTTDGAEALTKPIANNLVKGLNFPHNAAATGGRPWCPANRHP